MFSHTKTKEATSGVVEIKEASAGAMRALVHFCYGGRVEQLDETLVVDLFVLADRYQMSSLMICAALEEIEPTTAHIFSETLRSAIQRFENAKQYSSSARRR